MKNFSDLLAIDPDIKIRIRLSAITDNGSPRCQVTVNQHKILDSYINDNIDLEFSVGLKGAIKIIISMQEKIYSSENETAIIINSVEIDGLEIIPNYVHLAYYENEHHKTGPTSYLGINGTWTLDIAEPFYQWKHRETGQGWLLDPISGSRD